MPSNRNRGADDPFRHTRRAFLGAAGAAALTATGLAPADAAPSSRPAGFRPGIPLTRRTYQNWSYQIVVEDVWTASPADAQDVAAIVNWAHAAGYRVRARGKSHNWSPMVLPPGTNPARYLLIDTTAHLTDVTITPGSPATVTAGAGTTIDQLMTALEQAGYGLLETTAPGDLTLGGVLAIGGHGSGIPALGESRPPGGTYGSLANLVTSLTAIVWDEVEGTYAPRTYQRTDPDIGALLVHLGRAFITEVTLQVIPNQRLRCQNYVDIPAADLFARPGSNPNTIAEFLDHTGRIEAIWFPFTDYPWLKVWSVAPVKPPQSRHITRPYPYTFANWITKPESDLLKALVEGDLAPTPLFTNADYGIVAAGLPLTGTEDVWGWSRASLLYVQPTTLRIVEGGWAVLTARANVQQVLHQFYLRYRALVAQYQDRGEFPVNGPVEIRINTVDHPADVATDAAVPWLAPTRPRPDHPEWDTCVWLDIATLPGTPAAARFYTEIETWIWATFTEPHCAVRPEWSKAWAHTAAGAWTDKQLMSRTIPGAFRAGQADAGNWDAALATLNRLDPARVFTNPFLDTLLP
ncbi:MAG TPA: cholesterol oxidase substrate-binding domain-containing protein [Pseudonocardiaceae bacterium]|nr:cholesterol oxidase substrate-binding domain-containing protein [Pseudonocardiaceae bacterium]